MANKFELSVIIPVFNEQKRIVQFLKDMRVAAQKNWEIIFVDDGSKDDSANIIKNSGIRNLTVVSYRSNKGKGFAVKKGVDAARGKYIIFIDADGSVHPSMINKMLKFLKRHDFVVGSRTQEDSKVEQPIFREFVGICFNVYSNILFGLSIKDKLCGFKGFKSNLAKELFSSLKSNRWVFDIEIFFKAKKNNIQPFEIPIKWQYKDKSKMKIYDPLKIAFELVTLRLKLYSRTKIIRQLLSVRNTKKT